MRRFGAAARLAEFTTRRGAPRDIPSIEVVLLRAAQKNHVHSVIFLLSRGVNPEADVANVVFDYPRPDVPLVEAALRGHIECVQALLLPADQFSVHWASAFAKAVVGGHIDVARLIWQHIQRHAQWRPPRSGPAAHAAWSIPHALIAALRVAKTDVMAWLLNDAALVMLISASNKLRSEALNAAVSLGDIPTVQSLIRALFVDCGVPASDVTQTQTVPKGTPCIPSNQVSAVLHAVLQVALLQACKGPSIPMIEYLVSCGASLESAFQLSLARASLADAMGGSQPESPLRCAAVAGQLEVLNYLLARGANPLEEGLLRLVLREPIPDDRIVKRLVEAGCATTVNSAHVRRMAEANLIESVQWLLEQDHAVMHQARDASLIVACTQGYTDLAQLLIAHGSSVSSDGDAALQIACQLHRIEIVRLLLKRGANANARTSDGELNVLQAAQRSGFHEIVTLLRAHGASD